MAHRSLVASAASIGLLIACSSAARATELIYGFNTTDTPALDGFKETYSSPAGGSASQSTTTGVTEGNGALDFRTPATTDASGDPYNTGYTQVDVAQSGSTAVPTDLANATSFNLDFTFNPGAATGNINYFELYPVMFLEGGGTDNKLSASNTADGQPYLAGQVYNGTTLTFNLDSFTDPNAGDGVDTDTPGAYYTPAQIVAANQTEFPGSTLVAFGFELIDAGSATPFDLYIDNVTVPSVPEPAALGAVACGMLLIKRRRRR